MVGPLATTLASLVPNRVERFTWAICSCRLPGPPATSRTCLIVPLLGAVTRLSGRSRASFSIIVQALPGAISSHGRAGVELAGSVIELSLAPNWTGVEARLEA